MARNSTEQLVVSTIGSREDPLFPAHGVNTTLPGIDDVIMLVLKGVVFLHDPLYSCTILEEYLTSSFRLLADCVGSLNPAHSFVIHSECSFREGWPRELAHSPRYSKRVLDLGRVSLKTARSLVYYSGQI